MYAGKSGKSSTYQTYKVYKEETENKLSSTLLEKEVLIKEIHHRVKNNLNLVLSLLDLQADSIKDKLALYAYKQSQNQIRSIALIHEKLYQSKDMARIDFGEHVYDLVFAVFNRFGIDDSRCSFKLDFEDIKLPVDIATPCSLIINELVTNTLKHAFLTENRAEIFISLKAIQLHKFELIVSVNGVGFPKGFDFRNSNSLGFQLVNTLVNQLDGDIELFSEENAAFKIHFSESYIEVGTA